MRGYSNYPPGAENDPRAPWNGPFLLAECERCGCQLIDDSGDLIVVDQTTGERLDRDLEERQPLCSLCIDELCAIASEVIGVQVVYADAFVINVGAGELPCQFVLAHEWSEFEDCLTAS